MPLIVWWTTRRRDGTSARIPPPPVNHGMLWFCVRGNVTTPNDLTDPRDLLILPAIILGLMPVPGVRPSRPVVRTGSWWELTHEHHDWLRVTLADGPFTWFAGGEFVPPRVGPGYRLTCTVRNAALDVSLRNTRGDALGAPASLYVARTIGRPC